MLQKQLEFAQEREQFQREELKTKNDQLQAKDEQIESLQRLLGAPKPPQSVEQVQELKPESSQSIPEAKPIIEELQTELKRRSLFSRVIHAVLD
jgi:hypothetical protein